VPNAPFAIDSAHDADTARLELSGELDLATVAQLERAVDTALARGARTLVLDLAGISFVDSSGLRLFIVLAQRASADGWKLSLTRPQSQAMAVFQVSGVEQSLPLAEKPSAA
jgi:anti-sigma B factor antagonist